MDAGVLKEYGKPPEFTSFEAPPEPADGQLLVEVEAAGLNPADIALGEQTYYLPSPPVPYVPGIEAVGHVRESAAPGFDPGLRVYVDLPVRPHGTFAPRTLVQAATAVRVPDQADPAIGCALGVAGVAAQLCVDYRARLQPGEHVVVLGATGVVGAVAIQTARIMGAQTIVAVGRKRERLEAARQLGATAIAQIGADDLVATIREATGGGANVVIDMLCGEPAEAALEACAINGRLVQLGRSASETMVLKSATVRGKALSIIGHTNVWTPPEVRSAAYEWLLRHAQSGELQVEVERVPLEQVSEAWTRQTSSPGHKLVLIP